MQFDDGNSSGNLVTDEFAITVDPTTTIQYSASSSSVDEAGSFSLHVGVVTKGNECTTKSRHPQANWNTCAVTLQDLCYPRNDCH